MKKFIFVVFFACSLIFAFQISPWNGFDAFQTKTLIDSLQTPTSTNTADIITANDSIDSLRVDVNSVLSAPADITAVEDSVDTLRVDLDALGAASIVALPNEKMYIGGSAGVPLAGTVEGDLNLTRVGPSGINFQLSVGTIADADVSATAEINATKLGNLDVNNAELSTLDGMDENIRDAIDAINVGTGFWFKDGIQTNFTSTGVYAAGTGYGIVYGAGNVVQVPFFSDPSTMASNTIGYNTSNLYYSTNKIPDSTDVQEMIDATYSHNIPTVSTAVLDTLEFTERNYIHKYYKPTTTTRLLVSNSAYGVTKINIKGSAHDVQFLVQNSYPGSGWGTLKWVGGITPTFTDTLKVHEILLQRLDTTTVLGAATWYQ